MSLPLELSILLSKPPQDSPAKVIASVSLRCDALGFSHSGDLLTKTLTQQERDDLDWYLEEYWKWPYLEFAARGRQVEELLHEIGKRLYQGVFGSVEAREIIEPWQKQPLVQHQISIVSELPQVFSLPWELLHDAMVSWRCERLVRYRSYAVYRSPNNLPYWPPSSHHYACSWSLRGLRAQALSILAVLPVSLWMKCRLR
jgi:hypothetical protein